MVQTGLSGVNHGDRSARFAGYCARHSSRRRCSPRGASAAREGALGRRAVGQKVPDAHARDLDGKDVTLSSLYTKGPVLLAFYRGGWCPYCNSEIHALTTAYPDYQKRGVTRFTS
jgi:hypothetical protein